VRAWQETGEGPTERFEVLDILSGHMSLLLSFQGLDGFDGDEDGIC